MRARTDRLLDGEITFSGYVPPLPLAPMLDGSPITVPFQADWDVSITMYDSNNTAIWNPVLSSFTASGTGLGEAMGSYVIDSRGGYFHGDHYSVDLSNLPADPVPEPCSLGLTALGLALSALRHACNGTVP